MTEKALPFMEQIQKFSKWVRIVYMVLLAGYSLSICFSVYSIWSGSPLSVTIVYVKDVGLQQAKNFSGDGKIFLTIGALCYFALILKGFYHLCKLFYAYAEGKIFTTEANRQIMQLGVTVCLWAGLPALWYVLSNVAANLTFGTPFNLITFSLPSFLRLILALILGNSIICISWVMEKGREMSEDQRLTI